MTKKRVRRTKANDSDIIRLNNVGVSLGTIGTLLDVHPTTVSNRLKVLGIEPTYSSHAFMEDILSNLNNEVNDWLLTKVTTNEPIKAFITKLIEDRYNEEQNDSNQT